MKNIILSTLFIGGLILLSNDNPSIHVYGVASLLIGLYIAFSRQINGLFGIFNNTLKYNGNRSNTNCRFDINFKIEEILNHKILEEYLNSDIFIEYNKDKSKEYLLKKIKNNAKILLENKKIKEEIWINIKSENIYKDGELIFEDNFYYYIFIPFDFKDGNIENYNIKDSHHIHTGITIRLLLINGFLKLQIGSFQSCNINIIHTEDIGGSKYDTYKSFYDIIVIPIMYYKPFLNISKKHLNIVAEGIDGYYTKDGKNWSEKWEIEWKELHKDLNNYFYLNSFSENDGLDNKAMNIINEFGKKAGEIFKNQEINIDDDN